MNLTISLKKFFTNKNTVTIIGVIAILIILYFMYTKTIEKETEKKQVPVAAKEIPPETQITKDYVTSYQVAAAAMPSEKVITNSDNIVGKYTCQNSMIPEGSMFYTDYICEFEDLPGSWIKALKADEQTGEMPIPYYFSVNVTTTYGNSIQPGDYVDFWARAYIDDGKGTLVYSMVYENAEVLAVTDSSGKNVFRTKNNNGTPAFLNFGLSPDHFKFFKYVENVDGVDVNLIVIPHGGQVPTEKLSSVVSATQFRTYIEGFVNEKYKNDTKEQIQTQAADNNANSNEPAVPVAQ